MDLGDTARPRRNSMQKKKKKKQLYLSLDKDYLNNVLYYINVSEIKLINSIFYKPAVALFEMIKNDLAKSKLLASIRLLVRKKRHK